MRPDIPTVRLVETMMDKMARQIEEQQQEIDRLQVYNNELLIENGRLRKMYPAWMEEFAVRYDAVGDVDGRKLGAPSLELRMALARMLPDSRILTPWTAMRFRGETVRMSMSGIVMLAIRPENDDHDSPLMRAEFRLDMLEANEMRKVGTDPFVRVDIARSMLDMYAIRHGWYPLGVGDDVLRAAMEQR